MFYLRKPFYICCMEKKEILKKVRQKLTGTSKYSEKFPTGSIMEFENICTCDSNFMCEHRVNHVIDFLRRNIK